MAGTQRRRLGDECQEKKGEGSLPAAYYTDLQGLQVNICIDNSFRDGAHTRGPAQASGLPPARSGPGPLEVPSRAARFSRRVPSGKVRREAPLRGQPQDRPLSKSHDPSRLELGHYPFRLSIDTQFSDMDVVAHLNNIAIARYYESARVRGNFAVFGGDFFRRSAPFQMVLAQANISYLAEGNFPEPVQVGYGISRIGNSSFVTHQGLFQNGVCIGLCESVMVVTVNGKPSPIPPEARAAMQGILIPAH